MTATADRITEIGIINVVDGVVVEEWSTLVDPECSIPAEIQALTGITNAMVRDAPTFSDVAGEVRRRLGEAIFVAHNARFDYGFIKNEFRRLGESFTADVLCTVRLSRRLYPEYSRHGLDQLRERHHLTIDGRHRALGDARAAWQFVEVATREHSPSVVDSAIKALLKMPSLPPQLAPGVLDNLPEGPGVYVFYGVNDLPIYVGKSIKLRDRVRSHFSSDYRSANDLRLSTEITRIEVEETAGELGALLREIALIKSRMPLRNHRLRRNQDVVFLRLRDLNALPEYVRVDDIDFSRTDGLYGPFAAKSQAKSALNVLAADYQLCWHVIAGKPSGAACFGRQLHRCRGHCVGEETLLQHNMRLVAALAEKRLPDWPFDGRVAFREVSAETGLEAVHVFNRWCLVGSAQSEEALRLLDEVAPQGFDVDVYRVIRKRVELGEGILVLPVREAKA
ncbi:MAG: ethanolamine utilization protein [Aeromicrobium sp.]|nr:ethanolamine utilization protein [Burkholderiales bacterium]